MLGLSEAAYWSSWSVTHWTMLGLSGLACTLVGLYPFRNTSPTIMLAFFLLFSAALIAFRCGNAASQLGGRRANHPRFCRRRTGKAGCGV